MEPWNTAAGERCRVAPHQLAHGGQQVPCQHKVAKVVGACTPQRFHPQCDCLTVLLVPSNRIFLTTDPLSRDVSQHAPICISNPSLV